MFPDELMGQYRLAMVKFKKTQKTLFKRFGGPNMVELSDEFGQILATQFYNSDLPEYAGLCWMAAAKCEQDLDNPISAVDFLIRAGNAFVRADERASELFPGSNFHEHIIGAVRCYNDALVLLSDDSAMSAGIIRKLKKICPNTEKSSNFHSPTHRIHDLEISARLHIQEKRFLAALEHLTEIFDILQEEKTESSYPHLVAQVEVLLLLLLLLLKLPPGRQSPIHMKILTKYSPDNRNILKEKVSQSMSDDYLLTLQNLFCACCDLKTQSSISSARVKLLSTIPSYMISYEHEVLLEELLLVNQEES